MCLCVCVTRKNSHFLLHLHQVSNAIRSSPSCLYVCVCVLWYCMNFDGSVSSFIKNIKYFMALAFIPLFNHVDCVWFFFLIFFHLFVSFYSRFTRAHYTTLHSTVHIIASSFFFRLCHACTRGFGAFNTQQQQQQKLLLFIAVHITYRCTCSKQYNLQFKFISFKIYNNRK